MAQMHMRAPQTEGRSIHWARWYDVVVQALALGHAGKMRAAIAQATGAQPGERVLDVGCGTGDVALRLARLVGPAGQITGIDAAPEMIAQARRKAARRRLAIDFRLEPAEHLSFPDHTFDRAVSSLVMHHLPGDLKRQALLEIARVLKPGGRLTVVDFAGEGAPLHRHIPGMTHDLWDVVGAAGFTNIALRPLGFMRLACLTAQAPEA